MSTEFRLLGEFELFVAGRSVPIRGARQQGILAVLLVEANRIVPPETLLDRVWGTAPLPANPANAVQTQLTLLRRALAGVDSVSITWQSTGYRLAVDEQLIDLHRFRDLVRAASAADDESALPLYESALALWRGQPLASLDTPWLTALRASLDREEHAARLDLADVRLRLGQHTALLAELPARLDAHPLDERLAGQLMLALYRGGRPAEAIEHYHRLRRRLADELGTDPSPPLQQRYQQILDADPRLAAPATPTPAPAAPAVQAPVPRQLPAAPRRFTGRAEELAALAALDTAAQAGDTVLISALAGAGGIGKTWLALHWARLTEDRFPDGQLFVDLQGFSPVGQPLAPETVVAGFLGALGVAPDRLPADLSARSALFRSLVADRRMLVVLDNAADAAQVVPLLPGGRNCRVVVTSRRQLTSLVTGHGAHHLRLGVLDAVSAERLLVTGIGADRAAAEPDAITELLACCAGFPLALGIVVARAAAEPDRRLAELAADLRDATTRLGALADEDPAASLPAVLSWSLRALTDAQATVFGLLGDAPGPDISPAAAASLADLPPDRALAILRALEQACLLDRDASGRYRMHDLIRLHARDHATQLPQADRDAAQRRVIDFYLHTARAASQLLAPPLPVEPEPPAPGCRPLAPVDNAAAMAWFAAEDACLTAAWQQAVALGRDLVVFHLAAYADAFYERAGRLQDSVVCWRAGLAAAERLDDPLIRILAHRGLGPALFRTGRGDEALDQLQQSLDLSVAIDDGPQQARTHHALSAAWEERGDDRQALRHAEQALTLYREFGLPGHVAAALNAVGWYAARLGEYDRARSNCAAALELFRANGNLVGVGTTLDSLGYIDHHTGADASAVEHYRESIEVFRGLGHAYEMANALDGIGHPYLALGHPDAARTAWAEAVDLFRTQDRTADLTRLQQELDALPG